MFDTNIKISVVANAGMNNELLLKPRGEKKLQFVGASKQKNLRQQLSKNFNDYDSALTEKSWSILHFLSGSKQPANIAKLKDVVYPDQQGNHPLSEEFRYRLEWLTQLGLLERVSSEYELSTVGRALLDVAQLQDSRACNNAKQLIAR